MQHSARNQLFGTVIAVHHGPINAEVELDVGRAQKRVAVIARQSVERLGPVPGSAAVALIKGSWPILVAGRVAVRAARRGRGSICAAVRHRSGVRSGFAGHQTVAQHVVELGCRSTALPVPDVSAVAPAAQQAHSEQHLEMLGDVGLVAAHAFDDLPGGQFGRPDRLEDFQADWRRERPQLPDCRLSLAHVSCGVGSKVDLTK